MKSTNPGFNKIILIRKNYFLIVICFAFVFESCVSKKQLISSQNTVISLQNDSNDMQDLLMKSNLKLIFCIKNIALLHQQKDSMKFDYKNLYLSTQLKIDEQAIQLKNLQLIVESQNELTNQLKKTIAKTLKDINPEKEIANVQNEKFNYSPKQKILFKYGGVW